MAATQKQSKTTGKKPATKKQTNKKLKAQSKPRAPRKTKPKKTKSETPVVKDPPREPNLADTRSIEEGINLSSAKVKNALQHVVNREAVATLAAIQNCAPSSAVYERDEKNQLTNKLKVEAKPGIPLARIVPASVETYLKYVQTHFTTASQEKYRDNLLEEWKKSDTKKFNRYHKELKEAKEAHSAEQDQLVLEFRTPFSEKQFNLSFDSDFYKDHKETKQVKVKDDKGNTVKVKNSDGKEVDKEESIDRNEWETAADMVSRSKIRFSADAKIYVSAFLEFLVKQLASGGTYACINSKRKILKLEHALDVNSTEFQKRFPLYPIIANYKTTAEALSIVEQRTSDKTKKGEKKASVNQKELFQVFGDDNEHRLKFRYYIGEICREVKKELAVSEKIDGQVNTEYHHTNVGSDFACFSSSLIYELITVIGQMLEVEINSRNIKTVNDSVINTVIRNIHIAARVDYGPTLEFIRAAHAKYTSYMEKRHAERASAKQVKAN